MLIIGASLADVIADPDHAACRPASPSDGLAHADGCSARRAQLLSC
jgi:hypothetical protein